MDVLEQFLEQLLKSWQQQQFVKLTLSKCVQKETELKNIYIRKILIKGEAQLSFTFRYNTKDIVKNHTIDSALVELKNTLGKDFLIANLLTTSNDFTLQYNKKRKAHLRSKKPTTIQAPSTAHNKKKQYLIAPETAFLSNLGISSNGRVLHAHQDKFKQINKYVEIMSGLIQQIALPQAPKIVDMGCGKGYLTFALYQYLYQQKQLKAEITGIELREHLVEFCNSQAADLGWGGLSFVAQDIMDYDNDKIDILIALHACDIATDIAIAKGIKADAQLIVVAPCCHKQVRKQMSCKGVMQPILKNGILEERQAEIITDGIRALLLEAHGYKTKVFEFISTEHTAKNLMITAIKQPNANINKEPYQEKIDTLKSEFGIEEHYLESLLTL
ncbi:MAG: SAM-dependent methyltransferase [Aureispira sp.]|nr:SAM-dependent methyltransferase [Aureispira sp.]